MAQGKVRLSHRSRVRRAKTPRLRRARKLTAWLDSRVTALTGTGSGITFTADASLDLCTASGNHGLKTGRSPIKISNSGGALPAGTDNTTHYWPIVTGATTFKLAITRGNAMKGVAVDITGAGTGTQTAIREAEDRTRLYEWLHFRRTNHINRLTDIDNAI